MMPLNKKYLKILKSGNQIAQDKVDKLSQLGEVYIRKEEAKDFEKYVSANRDMSPKGLASRCRAQLLNLSAAYIELILLVLDQSEFTSYALGRELYERCSQLAGELLTSLGSIEEPWEVINNTSIGDFGSVERGPAIAAYAGLICMNSGLGDPLEVMVAALLMDVGLLDIDPRISRKIRISDPQHLSPSDLEDYQQHPIASLHRILGRKLPVTESIKNAILASHESSDGRGFPHKWHEEKIPRESMIIQLAELVDKKCLIKMGQARPDINKVRASIIEAELGQRSKFSLDFILKVRPILEKKN
jgi:response regulator RpfG family c-di-GMP phosphodiesterase